MVEQLTANLNVTSHTSTERMAEAHIYGSSRLGISAQVVETTVKRWKPPCTTDPNLLFTDWYPASANTANRNLRGWKRYELTNHLGNV